MESVLDSFVLRMEQEDDEERASPCYSPASPCYSPTSPHHSPNPDPADTRADNQPVPISPASPVAEPSPKRSRGEEERCWQASQTRFPARVRELIEAGTFDPNVRWSEGNFDDSEAPFGCCITSNDDGVPSTAAWFHRDTPLHNAGWFRDRELATLLVEAGADVNAYNALGRTPLQEAILRHNPDPEEIAFWIGLGADTNLVTREADVQWGWEGNRERNVGGYTALIAAMITDQVPSMRLLLEHGADPSWSSPDGWSILDVALLSSDRRAMALLLSFGAEFPSTRDMATTISAEARHDARELLAVASSNRVFPPKELRGIYRFALSRVSNLGTGTEMSIETARDGAEHIIAEFHAGLRAVAGIEPDATANRLCARCLAFQDRIEFRHEEERADEDDLDIQFADNQSQIDKSAAAGCPLCAVVADILDVGVEPGREARAHEKSDASLGQGEDSIMLRVQCKWYHSRNIGNLGVFRGGRRQDKLAAFVAVDETAAPIARIKQSPVTGKSESFDDALSTARDWLDICGSSPTHATCQRFESELRNDVDRKYPARLVAVGDVDKPPFLVEDVDGGMAYAVLSYVRGNNQTFRGTTNDTLQEWKQEIPLADLPRLFQDAITTTRKLGIKYIWIGQLCIIQDDEQDRQHETLRMDWIFLNAKVTLTSLVAETVSDSLAPPRSLRSANPVPIRMWRREASRPDWAAGQVHSIVVCRSWLLEGVGELTGPTHSRAWTLQEELLSSRVLYFGHDLLCWTCPGCQLAEADPTRPLQHPGARKGELWKRTLTKRSMRGIDADPGYDFEHPEPILAWQQQVEAYSKRQLGRPDERLAAIWGLSTFMARRCRNVFLAGLWWGDKLAESLSWRPKTALQGEPRSPSWTWAAVPGEISYDQVDRDCRPPGAVPLAAPVSHQIPDNICSSALLPGSTITLKGSLYSTRVLEKYNTAATRRYFSYPVRYVFDYEDHGLAVDELHAFDLLGFEQGPLPTGWGYPAYPDGRRPGKLFMLLDGAGLPAGHFRRVGLGVFQTSDWGQAPRGSVWISGQDDFRDTVTLV